MTADVKSARVLKEKVSATERRLLDFRREAEPPEPGEASWSAKLQLVDGERDAWIARCEKRRAVSTHSHRVPGDPKVIVPTIPRREQELTDWMSDRRLDLRDDTAQEDLQLASMLSAEMLQSSCPI